MESALLHRCLSQTIQVIMLSQHVLKIPYRVCLWRYRQVRLNSLRWLHYPMAQMTLTGYISELIKCGPVINTLTLETLECWSGMIDFTVKSSTAD